MAKITQYKVGLSFICGKCFTYLKESVVCLKLNRRFISLKKSIKIKKHEILKTKVLY